jgi:DNA-binding NarL/FixJ family response regulator
MVNLLRTLLDDEPNLRVIGQAKSASAAIDAIRSMQPDVVVVDLGLENSSGFDVLEALSNQASSQRPIIAVLTNYVSDRYREEAKRLGADYFFDKSREIVRMLRTMSEVVKARLRRNGSEDWR